MGALFPLTLPSSAQSTTSTSGSVCSTGGEMDIGDLMAACNFPELLARDLAASEAVFTSKAMTAGWPSAGCAAPGVDVRPSFQGAGFSRFASYRQDHLPVSQPQLHPLVTSEATFNAHANDDGKGCRVKRESVDSSSVMSMTMEPPLIRTRQQSVATAATSVSGRCSSLFSSKLSPSSPILSPCSSNRNSSSRGTWYEAEADPKHDEPVSSSLTGTSSVYETHRNALDLDGEDDDMARPRRSTGDYGRGASVTAAHFLEDCSDNKPRPHTASAQMNLERPRIIDIRPTSPKQTSSARRSSCSVESAMAASEPGEPEAVGHPEILEWQAGYVGALRSETMASMPVFATANGRTIIDASNPPSRDSTSRSQPAHPGHACSLPPNMKEGEDSGEAEATGARTHAEPSAEEDQKPSLADLRRWVDGSVETLASPPNSTLRPLSVSAPGIPLPPEVIESLRVSISCFPETMLLTSSLSIETIRAYSKKLRHRADLGRPLRSKDNQSLSSTCSHNQKPAKRWNLGWLSHNRRSKHQQQQQPQCRTLTRGTLPLDMSNQSFSPAIPVTPSWGPIKNIFPAASDYLCDALYAHLLAYNYISSLCPPPRPSPPAPPRTSHNHHRLGSRSVSVDDTATRNLKIPLKAASLLGMDDPVAAAAATVYQQQQQYHHYQQQLAQQRPRTRRLLTRRSSHPFNDAFLPPIMSHESSPGEAPAAMRELQTGLARCVGLLVATLKRTAGMSAAMTFGADKEPRLLILDEEEEDGRQVDTDPMLVRALCELVRCAEERGAGGV